MNTSIRIALLNDFIFCPKSIYFHQVYEEKDDGVYKDTAQTEGSKAHETVDKKIYSTSKKYIQGLAIYCEQYDLIGKIDMYNTETKTLVERKRTIKRVYDGYKYQLYAQYLCMKEMGYEVENLTLYSMTDNIKYPIPLPTQEDITKLEGVFAAMRAFQPDEKGFTQNHRKCEKCIYKELCDYYLRYG